MSYLGDTLTVGLVLVLLFGSIALYLYTRIQQTEQKVSLLESIILDLKLTGELPSFGGLPSRESRESRESSSIPLLSPVSLSGVSSSSDSIHLSVVEEHDHDRSGYKPFEDHEDLNENSTLQSNLGKEKMESESDEHLPLEEIQSLPVQEEVSFVSASSYDGLSLKELQSIVRARGLAVEKGAKKHSLIELLKRADANSTPTSGSEVKPGSTSSSSFLETSSPLSQDAE